MTMDDESGMEHENQDETMDDVSENNEPDARLEEAVDRTIPPELEEALEAALAAESEGADQGIAAWQKAWEAAPAHPEIVDALVRLYQDTEKWPALADFLKKRANKAENESHRIYALMTLARVYNDYINQDVMVVNTYQSIIKIKGDYLPAVDAAIAKYEEMERWPDLVKVLKIKGALVTDPVDKVEVFLRVAQLFLQRFSNQAEAIKAFEEVISADPTNDQAIDFLKEMYEKRRDWEKLAGVMESEAELLAEGPERVDAYVKIAELTTERLKKPAACIARWEVVLELDPENVDAIKNLSGLYERTKEWEKLASTLEAQLLFLAAPDERAPMLLKLGQVYGDKIGNDEKAVDAWKGLLEIQPDDRRAQEQLKKRYLAMQDWDALEEFYSASGKWDEFIRILEREAGRGEVDDPTKVSMQFKIAELWRDKKERLDRAAKCYDAILQIDPHNLEAAEAYIPILEDGKDPSRLADVLEVQLHHLDDEVEKLELQRRIAQIVEDEAGDMNRAFEGFLAAFQLRPLDNEIQDDLERVAGKAGQFDKVVDSYKNAMTGEDSADFEFKLRIARILDEELSDQDGALTYYDEIIESDPKNTRAVNALEKIYAQMGRYEELLNIYSKRLEMADDDEERVEILFHQALLWEEEVEDGAKAIEVLLQIVEMAGDEQRVLTSLDRLYTAQEQWPELVDVIERQLNSGVLEEAAELELKFRLGQVSETCLDDKEKALECYRDILLVDSEHEMAEVALEALLEDESQQREAARILTPVYESREQWEKLVGAMEILTKHADDAFEKYENLIKIGGIYGAEIASPEKAFAAYSRAFSVNPTDPRALEKLDELASILDTWNALVDLLVAGAGQAEDAEVVKDLWLRSARIYVTQISDVDKAVDAYQNVLESDSQNMEAIESLENIYTRTERWEELIGVYRTKVEACYEPSEKENVYRQMAMIYEDMLEQPGEAVSCLKEILNFDPMNEEALGALDKLFVSLGQWTDLADNLQQQLSLDGDPDAVTGLKIRLADLRETKLDEIGGAVEIYREILELDVSNDAAIVALERIIENADFRAEIAGILEPIYQAIGDWQKLIDVYEIMVQEEESETRKVELLHQMASLYESSGDEPEKAFKTFGRALFLDPADERTKEELERMASVLVLYDDLVALYVEAVEGMENDELAAEFHLKIAQIQEEQLQNNEVAIEHYQAVLAIDPMHLDAASALERAYQLTENYAELANTYLKKVEIVSDPNEQKSLLFQASQIYEEILESADKAIDVYLRVLEIDEDDLTAIGHLEALYLRLERWEELQNIYNRKVELVNTSEEKREILYILGAMYESELKDTRKSIETYQRILEFEPDDIQAIQRLDVLFTEMQEWHDLLSVLEREVELSMDPDETISFKFRIGELFVKHLEDDQRAVDYFKEIVTIHPEHQLSIDALEGLLGSAEDPLPVVGVLEPLYKDAGEWRKLINVLEVKNKNTDDPWQRVEILHEIAGYLESELHLDAVGEAFDIYARALDDDKVNEKTLERLEELASQTGRWEDLVKLFDAQLEEVVEDEHAVALGLRAGRIYEEQLALVNEAIERFQKVVAFDPENETALARLDVLFQAEGRWEDLASVLQKEALIVDEPEKSLEIQFRLGQVYQLEMNEIDQSIEVYRDILAAEPAHESSASALELLFTEGVNRLEIGEILEPLYRMQADWDRLAHLYETQIEDLPEVEDKIAMMHRIAEIQEDKALDPAQAFHWYARAFAADPFDERSAEEIERLAKSVDLWAELADVYQDIFSQKEDEEIKRLVAKRLARVAEEELGDVERAEQAYRQCLELGGDDMDVLVALDRIYTENMEWQRLVAILDMLAEIVSSDEEKVEYVHRMGSIYETQLDEIEKARQCYHKVVDDLDPAHGESLDCLEIIYADREAWAELYDVYSRKKDATLSEANQADLFAKMATIASDCLDDMSKAIEYWGNVLDILGEDTTALDALADLYSKQENWNELVEVLERAVIVAEDDDARIRLYSQLGLVWGECLSRDRNALENWENVLSIDMDNLSALKAIAGIHEANQDWTSLIETLERIIEVGASVFEAEELKGYYAQLGTIYADTLEQPIEGIEAWSLAHEVDPSDLGPVEALIRLYEEQMMWEEQIDAMSKKGDLVDGDEEIETLLSQAKVFEEKLEEPLRAEESYSKILSVAPLHEYAFERFTEIKTEKEEWEQLNEASFKRLDYLSETPERVKLFHLVASVYEEKLNQPENAFVVVQRAFEEDYSSDDTAGHLERLASLTGKWDELLASTGHVLQTVEDKDTRINLCLKIGKWYADELGHPDYSISYYQQVLQLDPENVQALKLMGELYRNAKQWPELVQVLTRAVECEKDPDAQKDILVDVGTVQEEYIGDMPEARKAYLRALEIDPGLEIAINALERILGRAEDWQALLPILRRKLETLENDQQGMIPIYMRIAKIYEENLDGATEAIDEYQNVLAIDQGYLPALKGLERIYEQLQRWPDLMDVLELQIDYVTSERERVEIILRIAEMLDREFLKPDKAAERYEEVLNINPAHQEALVALEKLYRNTGKWQDLIATLERHIDAISERTDKVAYYKEMGQIYVVELDDVDRGVDAYNEILNIDAENEDALDELARLQVAMEDWGAAHESLQKLANTVTDPERKVDLYYRLGILNEENLLNRRAAQEHFLSALDIEAGHLPTLAAIRKIYIDEGDWQEAVKVLETEQEHTENARKRSELQYELGTIYRERLDDETSAISWYEEALKSDSDNQAAAEPLVDVYIESERWEEAETLLDMLIRLGGKRDGSELQTLQLKLALVADKIGNLEKALEGYDEAYALDASHLPTVLGLADVQFRLEEWDKAFKFYQMVLVHHREKQADDEIVEIFYRLGSIKAKLNERRKALNMFDKALEIDPAHRSTLQEVIGLHEDQNNHEQVIHYKKAMIEAVDPEEQFDLLVEVGDIWHEKLKNQQKAISSYVEATNLKPDDRPTLHKLLPLYQATKQWRDVVDVISRVASMEEDKDKQAKLYYTMGVIFRDEIKSADDAVEYFNLSLDGSLENLKAFEAIDRILTQKKEWKTLERAYRKMLHRIAGKGRPDLEINLWHFLGEIYRSRLNQYEPAAEAFKMAAALDPDNAMRHEILAELYLALPNGKQDAVAEFQWLIRKNPYHVDSYKALRKLYFDNKEYDKAWCLCATLVFLKKADTEEQQFFEQYRAKGMVRAQARLDNEHWLRDLFHPEESIYVGKILEAVTNATRRVKIQPIKAFALKKNQKRPVNDTMAFSKTFYYAAQVLNLPVIPELYIQEDKQDGLRFAITEPMATACGASLLSGYSPQDLLFIVGKHLTYYRPEHYIRWVLPTHTELKMLLLAAIKIGAPEFQLPADKTGVLQQYVEVLNTKLEPVERENLTKVVKRFVKKGEVVDIKKWIRCVELTGCRVGFLLANDLEVAARMIQSESGTVDDIPAKEKIKELVLFSVSEEYFNLRKAFGISIGETS